MRTARWNIPLIDSEFFDNKDPAVELNDVSTLVVTFEHNHESNANGHFHDTPCKKCDSGLLWARDVNRIVPCLHNAVNALALFLERAVSCQSIRLRLKTFKVIPGLEMTGYGSCSPPNWNFFHDSMSRALIALNNISTRSMRHVGLLTVYMDPIFLFTLDQNDNDTVSIHFSQEVIQRMFSHVKSLFIYHSAQNKPNEDLVNTDACASIAIHSNVTSITKYRSAQGVYVKKCPTDTPALALKIIRDFSKKHAKKSTDFDDKHYLKTYAPSIALEVRRNVDAARQYHRIWLMFRCAVDRGDCLVGRCCNLDVLRQIFSFLQPLDWKIHSSARLTVKEPKWAKEVVSSAKRFKVDVIDSLAEFKKSVKQVDETVETMRELQTKIRETREEERAVLSLTEGALEAVDAEIERLHRAWLDAVEARESKRQAVEMEHANNIRQIKRKRRTVVKELSAARIARDRLNYQIEERRISLEHRRREFITRLREEGANRQNPPAKSEKQSPLKKQRDITI